MRTSLAMRAACASAAVTLFLVSGPQAAFAHGQMSSGAPAMRPGFVHSHGSTAGRRSAGRQPWPWRSQNRWSRNGRFWNQGGFGSGFWYSPYGYSGAASGSGGGVPLLIVVGAPSFNDFPAAPNGDPGPQGGCVIHKLAYDSAGKYVGERQTSGC